MNINRKSFIRSFITLCAAPSVLAHVDEHQNIIHIDVDEIVPQKQKLCYYWKIYDEALEDEGHMEWLFFNEYSHLNVDLKEAGFDLSKPYNIQIGYENDDFTRNLKTCIITQYK